MKIHQVAAQLYTLRDHLKTPAAIAASLKKVRAIGYTAVQASGLGPIPEADLVRLLQDNGLTLCATHEGSDQILNTPELAIEKLRKLGCKHTAYPFPAGVKWESLDEVKALAKKLDAAGAKFREAGLVLSYHNHGIEFVPFDGRTALEIIYAEASPENLKAELDTYWIHYGGGNPASWCRKMAGRMPLLHLKDYAFSRENKPVFAEIGRGTLEWNAIIPAAEKSGCEWFIVEQDTCPGDPFDSLKMSFDFIRANLVG